MKYFICVILTFSLQITTWLYAQSLHACKPVHLTCDLIENTDFQLNNGYIVLPVRELSDLKNREFVTINNQKPDFGWALADTGFNIVQSAYQILVSSSLDKINADLGDYWDSKQVNSSNSCGVTYSGISLQPNTLYYWKVRVWHNNGQVSEFSAPQYFLTGGNLTEHSTPRYPLEKTDQVPVSQKKIKEAIVADFGADAFCSQIAVTIATPNSDTVLVKLGEALKPDGEVNELPPAKVHYRLAKVITLPGVHTYLVNAEHNGGAIKLPVYIGAAEPFRYVQLERMKKNIGDIRITRAMVSYPFDDSACDFVSSDTVLNKVWQLCKYSMKATSFAGQFIDGDRERKPYEADALINQLGYYYADGDYSIARYSHEYLITHATWPTEWVLMSVIMAWNDYLYTGNLSSLRYYYKELQYKSLSKLEQPNGLISTTRLKAVPDSELYRQIHLKNMVLKDIVDWPASDGFVKTDYNSVVNSFYYADLICLAKIAGALGIKKDMDFYRAKARSFKKIFNNSFWDEKRGVYKDGITTAHVTIHANMFPLAFGLNNPGNTARLMDYIRSRGMACTVYGAQFLLDAIYNGGDGQYALKLLTSTSETSWYNMLREGSTITMEAWGNKYKANQDWNHAWGAAPANIIPRRLLGFEPLAPGWSLYKIEPQMGNLNWLHAYFSTVKGVVAISCVNDQTKFELKTTVPPNTHAQIIIPGEKNSSKLYINNKISQFRTNNGKIILPVLSSGNYVILLLR